MSRVDKCPVCGSALEARINVYHEYDKCTNKQCNYESDTYDDNNKTDEVVMEFKSVNGAGVYMIPEITMCLFMDLLQEAVTTDGAHHKQWYLEKIAECFKIRLRSHDEGMAP